MGLSLRRWQGVLALLATLVPAVSPPVAAGKSHTGFAAHYRPGLMERVARNRGLKPVECMVASPYHRLGTWVTIHSPKQKETLRCRVTDIPQRRHRPALIRRGIVVELDFKSAKVLCGIRRVAEKPPRACTVVVT